MIQFIKTNIVVTIIAIASSSITFADHQKIAKKYKINKSNYGFSLVNLDNPTEQYNFNSKKNFIPASLTKILTTVYTLDLLPENFRFETNLFYTGKIKKETLFGDIYLHGTGDPFFTHNKMMALLEKLLKRGIKKVEGNFFYDASSFPSFDSLSSLGLGDKTYNPSLSALNLEFNRFKSINKKIIPPLDHISLTKSKKALSPGQRFKYTPKESLELWNYGPIGRYKYAEDIPIKNSSLFSAKALQFFAKKRGLTLKDPRKNKLEGNYKSLAVIKSPSLHSLVHLMMEYSNNLFAEVLLLKSSKEQTFERAASKMKNHLIKNYDMDKSLVLKNGSGLTIENKVTPLSLTHLIVSALKKHNLYPFLSIGGQTGWIAKRFREENTAFNIWAKTGSLDYINNISGVLYTKSGKQFAFSFFVNDFKKRKILERPNSIKINKIRDAANKWKLKTTPFIDETLTSWIQNLK